MLPIENKLEDFSTILIDSPGVLGDNEGDIGGKVKSANAILIVYDMSDEQTIASMKNFWLPFVQKYNTKVPVIIVGNKLDLVRVNPSLSYYTRIGKILRPLMREFSVAFSKKQIEMGIEVSAKDSINILAMLYCAQSSVIFPLSVLMNLGERELTGKYKKALTRIFRILDADNSGNLSDTEMNSLQNRVFENELTQDDIKSLKEIVKEEVATPN